MKIDIIGAGMAGLLAASMLRSEDVDVLETQTALPNNHAALLRFRTLAVSEATGIPFKRVEVKKGVHLHEPMNDIAAMLAYSRKVSSQVTMRSISKEVESNERFIAPEDFIQRLANGLKNPIKFNFDFAVPVAHRASLKSEKGRPIISTLQMPLLAQILGYEFDATFHSKAINVITATLPEKVDVYVSLYVPHKNSKFSRISITGRKLIIELVESAEQHIANHLCAEAMEILGLQGLHYSDCRWSQQRYGKIDPIPDDERKNFILWATEKHNIYSLGRFATWRPGLLLDDVVNDVRVIQQLVDGKSNYNWKVK